jgi:hypothetical protein
MDRFRVISVFVSQYVVIVIAITCTKADQHSPYTISWWVMANDKGITLTISLIGDLSKTNDHYMAIVTDDTTI